jgi:hypothetical protein
VHTVTQSSAHTVRAPAGVRRQRQGEEALPQQPRPCSQRRAALLHHKKGAMTSATRHGTPLAAGGRLRWRFGTRKQTSICLGRVGKARVGTWIAPPRHVPVCDGRLRKGQRVPRASRRGGVSPSFLNIGAHRHVHLRTCPRVGCRDRGPPRLVTAMPPETSASPGPMPPCSPSHGPCARLLGP